jgi:L-2,4-diaminobutyrate decarboxylase
MHGWPDETERVAHELLEYARERLQRDPPPLNHPLSQHALEERAGETITPDGLGAAEALRLFCEVLAPADVSVDHPWYLSFVPGAPTELAMLFDLAVGVSSTYAGSWLEASGAVYAENQALRWIADLAGLPASAGGCFVSGGTTGNLSALHAAREAALARRGSRPDRWQVVMSDETHSSVLAAARVLDVDVAVAPSDERFRLTGEAVEAELDRYGDAVVAVVATAGTTNLGVYDDLAGIARVCREHGVWLHVDGAYGLAALAAPSARPLFDGIETADSLIVAPHKWLVAPYDCCALLYRDPEAARRAHGQHAGYLEAIVSRDEWNPSDYAIHLSRRARGLPFWFSLAAHGTQAYVAAVESVLEVARAAADEIRRLPELELVPRAAAQRRSLPPAGLGSGRL